MEPVGRRQRLLAHHDRHRLQAGQLGCLARRRPPVMIWKGVVARAAGSGWGATSSGWMTPCALGIAGGQRLQVRPGDRAARLQSGSGAMADTATSRAPAGAARERSRRASLGGGAGRLARRAGPTSLPGRRLGAARRADRRVTKTKKGACASGHAQRRLHGQVSGAPAPGRRSTAPGPGRRRRPAGCWAPSRSRWPPAATAGRRRPAATAARHRRTPAAGGCRSAPAGPAAPSGVGGGQAVATSTLPPSANERKRVQATSRRFWPAATWSW